MNKLRTAPIFALLLVSMVLSMVAIPAGQAAAISTSEWQAGRIIDDGLFTDKDSMSVAEIQNFLNNLVPTCDTNGTQSAADNGYPALTHAQYATQVKGWAGPPYVCLRNYFEVPKTAPSPGMPANNFSGSIPAGAISAAQMIYNAAQQYRISPKVLLIKIRAESAGPLTTDTWPLQSQYTYAMGAHCPDSGPGGSANCDPNYAGFSIQIAEAAALFRYYIDNMNQSWWPYKKLGNNTILYNPNASCGSSVVNITTMATAALYTYTPYQPNDAALAAGYGTASCGAYGNRNFWLYYNEWFGPTKIDVYPWSVQEAIGGDGRYWLVIGNTKRWIPNGTILNDWTLQNYPHMYVAQDKLNAIPTLPTLANLGLTSTGQYVFVDNGQKYYLGNSASMSNWGYTPDILPTAVPLYSILASMPNELTGTVNQYVKKAGTSENYLMSGGTLYPLAAGTLARWAIPNSTVLTADNIALMPQGATINYQVSFSGKNYMADLGSLLAVDDTMSAAYGGSIATGFVPINGSTGGVFGTYNANQFVQQAGSSTCYYLIGGKRYYVLNSQVLSAWGGGGQPQAISSLLLNSVADGGVLGSVAKTTPDNTYYVLDGSAHRVPTDLLDAYTGGIPSIQLAAGVFTARQGSPITSPIFQVVGTGDIYTAIGGKYYHINDGSELNAFGYPAKYPLQGLDRSALFSMAYGGGVSKVMSYGGTTYYLQNAKAYPIDAAYLTNWLGSATAPTYPGTDFSTRFAVQTTTLQDLVKDSSGKTWLADNGRLINMTSFADAYSFRTPVTLDIDNLPRINGGTYLVRSANTNDSRIWLINKGTKQWIVTAAEYYGFGGDSTTPVTALSDAEIAKIPTATQLADPSIIVYSGTKGLKFLNGSDFYEFPVGSTATANILTGNPTLELSATVYAALPRSNGPISQLIKDATTQQVYYIENGQKRWLTNGTAYSHYSSLPLITVPGYFAQWLPTGAPITN